jgi:hypothetical protein
LVGFIAEVDDFILRLDLPKLPPEAFLFIFSHSCDVAVLVFSFL